MRQSKRLQDKEAKEAKKLDKIKQSALKQSSRKPKQCTKCFRTSRTGTRLCQICYSGTRYLENQRLVIRQGCSSFHSDNEDLVFRWSEEFPSLAEWISDAWELDVGESRRDSKSKKVVVKSWKVSRDGAPLLSIGNVCYGFCG